MRPYFCGIWHLESPTILLGEHFLFANAIYLCLEYATIISQTVPLRTSYNFVFFAASSVDSLDSFLALLWKHSVVVALIILCIVKINEKMKGHNAFEIETLFVWRWFVAQWERMQCLWTEVCWLKFQRWQTDVTVEPLSKALNPQLL